MHWTRTRHRHALLKLLLAHAGILFLASFLLPSPLRAASVEVTLTEDPPGQPVFPAVVASTMIPDLAYTVRTARIGETLRFEPPSNAGWGRHSATSRYLGQPGPATFAIAGDDHRWASALYLPARPGTVQIKLDNTLMTIMVVEVTAEFIRYYRVD